MKNSLDNKKNNFLEGESSLLEIDKEIKHYAEEHQMKLTKNYHDWPERSLSWKNKKVTKQIQIYLDGENLNNFLVWGCTFKDTIFGRRYWWKVEPIIFTVPLDWNTIEKQFNLLKEALEKIIASQLIRT